MYLLSSGYIHVEVSTRLSIPIPGWRGARYATLNVVGGFRARALARILVMIFCLPAPSMGMPTARPGEGCLTVFSMTFKTKQLAPGERCEHAFTAGLVFLQH